MCDNKVCLNLFRALTAAIAFVVATVSTDAWAARTFYIDPVNGSNGNDGLSEATAWKNFERINTPDPYFVEFTYPFQNDDRILFKRGAAWDGQSITITTPQMSIGAYGDENAPKPRIRGAASLDHEYWIGGDLDIFIDKGPQVDRFYGWAASADPNYPNNVVKADTDTHDGKGYSARLVYFSGNSPQLFKSTGSFPVAASSNAKFRFWAKITSGQLLVAVSNGALYYDSSTGTWVSGFRPAWTYTAADAANWTAIETPIFTTDATKGPLVITFRPAKGADAVGEMRVDDLTLAGVWEPHAGNVYKRLLLPFGPNGVSGIYNGNQTALYHQKLRVEDLENDGDWFWEGNKATSYFCRAIVPGTDYDFYQVAAGSTCQTGYEPYGPIPDNRVLYIYWNGGLDSLNQQDLHAARGEWKILTLNADGTSVDGIAVERGARGITVLASNTTVTNSTVRYIEGFAMLFDGQTGYFNNITVSGNEVDSVGGGIYFYRANNSHAFNNRINQVKTRGTKVDHEALALQFGNYNVWEYNHISNAWVGMDLYGDVGNPASNNTMRYNLIESVDYVAMIFGGAQRTQADGTIRGYVYDNIAYNNVVRNSGESYASYGLAGAGVRVNNTPYTGRNYIYNNTLYGNSRNFAGLRCFSGGFTFMNNISLNPTLRHLEFEGNDTDTTWCIPYNNLASSVVDHNLYWPADGSSTALFEWHGPYYSFQNYSQATGRDSHGLAADPVLANIATGDFYWAGTPSVIAGAGDYRLTANSPAIDRGTDVGLTSDIAGNPVQGIPDIGAYEGGALADLITTQVAFTATSVRRGKNLFVTNSVKNQGSVTAGGSTVGFRLSTDTVYGNADDMVISTTRSVSSLAVGATSTATTKLTLPSNIPVGSYYVCGKADALNAVTEGNETNNTLCSGNRVNVTN